MRKPQTPSRPGRWISAVALLLAVVATPLSAQPETVVLSVDLPDRPMAGAQLFEERSCSRCHALGDGLPDIGPDLSGQLFTGTAMDLAGALWNHSPTMHDRMQDFDVERTPITSEQMASLVAYLGVYRYNLAEHDESGNATAGEQVYAEKRCATCHEQDDPVFGRPIGPDLEPYGGSASLVLLAQAMWNHGGEMADVMRREGMAPPVFAGRDMADLAAHLQAESELSRFDDVALEPGDPRLGRGFFVTKRCDACHAIAGRGGEGGPDLGLRDRPLAMPVAEIAGVMWNHSQGMAEEFERRGVPRGTMSGQEMADLIAYVYFADWANVRGTPARGAEVYAGTCAVCHSLGGAGRIGPDLATALDIGDPLSLMTSMWNHATVMEQEMQRMGVPWPTFGPGDAADLAAFLMMRRTPLAND